MRNFEPLIAAFTHHLRGNLRDYKYLSGAALEDAVKKVMEADITLKATLEHNIDDYKIEENTITLITWPIVHEVIDDPDNYIRDAKFSAARDGKRKYYVKSVTMELKFPLSTANVTMKFEEENFVHGHLNPDGSMGCLNKYGSPATAFTNGPSALLTLLIGFASFSRYGTHMKGEVSGARKDKVPA